MAEKTKDMDKNLAVAKLNNCPTSPRKMRIVADLVRGKNADQALDILRFSQKEASRKLEKLLINGVYEINVSENLPIVVSGKADTPSNWINASIGTLNNVTESYRLLVEIMDGSEVIFNDG